MKIRMKGDSVRLRLQQREVAQLRNEGRVAESLRFGPGISDIFVYALELVAGDTVQLQVRGTSFTVLIPTGWAAELADTDNTGFDVMLNTAPGVNLRVIVEKDYRCLQDRVGEDDSDAFINPDAGNCSN